MLGVTSLPTPFGISEILMIRHNKPPILRVLCHAHKVLNIAEDNLDDVVVVSDNGKLRIDDLAHQFLCVCGVMDLDNEMASYILLYEVEGGCSTNHGILENAVFAH